MNGHSQFIICESFGVFQPVLVSEFSRNWPYEKEALLQSFSCSASNTKSVSNFVKAFKDTLFKYPNSFEVNEEKAKYGLGPPNFLISDTPEDPRDVKSALWTCILRGNCHKHRQTKILLRIDREEYFDELEKVGFKKPNNQDTPLFLCAYHFTEINKNSGIRTSAFFLRHWFQYQTVPEGVVLRLKVRSNNNKRARRSTTFFENMWDLYQRGILLHEDVISKMKGANAA